MALTRCQMCARPIEDRLLSQGLCPTCHEEMDALREDVYDAWRRSSDVPPANVRQLPGGCPYGHTWCGGRGYCGYERGEASIYDQR